MHPWTFSALDMSFDKPDPCIPRQTNTDRQTNKQKTQNKSIKPTNQPTNQPTNKQTNKCKNKNNNINISLTLRFKKNKHLPLNQRCPLPLGRSFPGRFELQARASVAGRHTTGWPHEAFGCFDHWGRPLAFHPKLSKLFIQIAWLKTHIKYIADIFCHWRSWEGCGFSPVFSWFFSLAYGRWPHRPLPNRSRLPCCRQ